MSNANGYEIYIVVRDRDYPMHDGDPEGWEAGWHAWTGRAGDLPPQVIHDYERALAIAEELTITTTPNDFGEDWDPSAVMEALETDDLLEIAWAALEGGDPIATAREVYAERMEVNDE